MNASKRKILLAAYALFRKKGYHATGLQEILEKARAGKSQLYHHFDDKEELLLAALQFYSEKVYTETAKFMQGIQSLDEFEQIISGSRRLSRSQSVIVGCFFGSIAGELAATHPRVRAYLVQLYQDWQKLFVGGLEELKNRSLLSKDARTDELAEFFLVSVQGAFILAKTTGDLAVIDRSIQKSLNYLRSYSL